MEFALLGDIEARVDGRRVDLGPGRQRCVLAALLVNANQPVPVDQLLDRVWGDRPPQRVRSALYSYLSRLRQILAPVDGLGIVRRPGGYLVAIDPAAVDLHRFAQLTARARAATDPTAAAALFEEALGLWRGEAFGTLDTPWLNGIREALNRERLAAELDRYDLALDGGRHADVLSDLSARAAAHPLDERLAGQLVLALYRCGRQADALAVYQQMRVRLAEDLGADPSPALQRLYQQILTADSGLAAPAPAVRPARVAVPRQLPASPRSFAGRVRQLAELTSAVTGRGDRGGPVAISAIGGTGGMGKTWLAVRWAYDHLDRFPDGQLYVNLRGYDPSGEPVPPAAALRTLLDALGVQPTAIPVDLDCQAALYRRLVADKRMLILLDNAHDTTQVAPLLPTSPTCTVLVTSRYRLSGLITAHGARPLALDALTDDEAHEVLVRHLGSDRVAAEPAAVDTVIRRCAGLPLALGIVAARAALQIELPLAALAEELSEASARLDALDAGELGANIRAVLSCSFDALQPAAARVFALLGLAPGPDISLGAAACLAGLPVARTRVLIRELANVHLVHEHVAGRYRMHDLVRLYAAEQARTVDSDAALHRLLDYYLHSACAADQLLAPHRCPIVLAPAQPGAVPRQFTDHREAMAWFAAEHVPLLAAQRLAGQVALDTHTWQFGWALNTFFTRSGHWRDCAGAHEVALAAAARLSDRAAQAHAHRGIAYAYTCLDRNADAEPQVRRALDLFVAIGDQTGQADTHRSLARVYARQHRYRPALRHAELALDLYRTVGHRSGEASALNALGWFHAHLDNLQEALDYCGRSLLLHRKIGDPLGEAAATDSLGYVHHRLGQLLPAADLYRTARTQFRDIGDRYYEANSSVNLGDILTEAGDPGPARAAWRYALEILDQLGHPEADGVRARLDQAHRNALLMPQNLAAQPSRSVTQ